MKKRNRNKQNKKSKRKQQKATPAVASQESVQQPAPTPKQEPQPKEQPEKSSDSEEWSAEVEMLVFVGGFFGGLALFAGILTASWYILGHLALCGSLFLMLGVAAVFAVKSEVEDIKEYEAIPRRKVGQLLDAPAEGVDSQATVLVQGKIKTDQALLSSPMTKTRCVFFHYAEFKVTPAGEGNYNYELMARKEGGRKCWVEDETGSILFDLSNPKIRENVLGWKVSRQTNSLGYRCVERKILPGQFVTVTGTAELGSGGQVRFTSVSHVSKRTAKDRLSRLKDHAIIAWFIAGAFVLGGLAFWVAAALRGGK